MGRCGGLKEGGHHRRAIDVAQRKKAAKAARREAQLAAGHRAAALERLLALDADCDVYLLAAPDPGQQQQQRRPLCRSYFRFDRCANRRCKLSHEHSIADACACALPGISRSDGSGSEKTDTSMATDTSTEEAPQSLPALELIPGGLLRSRRRTAPLAMGPRVPGAAGAFEELPESAVRDIAALCPDDAAVGHLMRSCRYVRRCLRDCRDVRRREGAAARVRLEGRNGRLLSDRATAGRLRFAVSYMDAGCHAAAAAAATATAGTRKSGKKGGQKGRGASANAAARRPTLAYDFEDPRVFRAFEQTMSLHVPHGGTAGDAAGGGEAGGDDLSSALAANCRVNSR